MNTYLKNEKIFRDVEHNLIKSEIANVSNSMNNTNEAVFSSLNKILTENHKIQEFTKKKLGEIDKNILLHKSHIAELRANVYDTVTKLLLNEITQKAIEESFFQEISKLKLFEKSIISNRNEIRKLNDRIVDAFKSLGGISQQGTKINDMLVEKEIRDDVEKMMSRMVEECIMAEAKEENNKNIKRLEYKFQENLKQQEKQNNEFKNNIEQIGKNGEILVKDLEKRINTSLTNSNIDKSVMQMITNTDIENLYDLLNNVKSVKSEAKLENQNLEQVFKLIEQNNEVTKKALANYTDILDNKVNNILEKLKQDNINMWENSISLGQKINTPEEIKKLIQEVPPVISPLDETLQKIMDLNFKHPEPKPFIPDLYENEKIIDEENYGKIVINPVEKENKVNEEKNDINPADNDVNNNVNANKKENSEKNSNGTINSNNSKSTGSKKKKK